MINNSLSQYLLLKSVNISTIKKLILQNVNILNGT